MSYFDSAFVAKFYLDEPGSDAVRRLAESLGEVQCVLLGRLEVSSVFHRKWREGAYSDHAFREVSAQFAQDCGAGMWHWLPVTPALVEAAINAVRRLPINVFLRSADALHLTCAREHGFDALYSNDRRVLDAARHFGLRGIGLDPS